MRKTQEIIIFDGKNRTNAGEKAGKSIVVKSSEVPLINELPQGYKPKHMKFAKRYKRGGFFEIRTSAKVGTSMLNPFSFVAEIVSRFYAYKSEELEITGELEEEK